VEQTYSQDVLHLVLTKDYLAKLLENKVVAVSSQAAPS
jgi:hypothetical protein